MTDVEPVVAFLQAAHEKAEREAPHAHVRGCSAWDDYHYRHELTDLHPIAGDACDCDGPRSALARVQAERAVIASYEHADREYRRQDRGASPDYLSGQLAGAYGAVLDLAHGHRHTVPGYDPAWTPEGAEP